MEAEVWVVYICLFLMVIVYFLMKKKPDDEIKSEKDTGTTPASSSYYASSVGRRLECTEEEMEQSLERLVGILSNPDARKREAHTERVAFTQQREPSGKGPSQVPLIQSNIQEKASHPGSHESLVDEIEQAVQETVDTNVHVRRRQAQPASRVHQEAQWTELSGKF